MRHEVCVVCDVCWETEAIEDAVFGEGNDHNLRLYNLMKSTK